MKRFVIRKKMNLLSQSEQLCKQLHQTYDARIINFYPPELQLIILKIASKYGKAIYKNPKINHILISLINNLQHPTRQPVTQYISGPSVISKWEGRNKIIYLFGETSHFDRPACAEQINTLSKGSDFHMKIRNYFLQLFKTSPVFIDFYVEFGVMLNDLESVRLGTGQTLHEMLYYMKGCFGKLIDRDCPYNVRMHGVDVRRVVGEKAMVYNQKMYSMDMDMKMYLFFKKEGGRKHGVRVNEWISPREFKKKYKDLIKSLEKIRTDSDIIKMVVKIIDTNPLFEKEIRKSTLEKSEVIDFFIKNQMKNNLKRIRYGSKFLGIWFKSLRKSDSFQKGMDIASLVLTIAMASLVDVYAVTRMFKTFDVGINEHYPREANNIIYYAGDGHTKPMASFLEHIGFNLTEHTKSEMLSCVNMDKIKQPLFS